jgi:hypothetical protein
MLEGKGNMFAPERYRMGVYTSKEIGTGTDARGITGYKQVQVAL